MGQVLETKSQFVADIVDGGVVATAGAATVDVLSELQTLIEQVGPTLGGCGGDVAVDQLLRKAADLYAAEYPPAGAQPDERAPEQVSRQTTPAVSPAATQALARALSRPPQTRYLVQATKPGTYYTLEVDGTDVRCTCRGFDYRGQCRHSRSLKAALVAGQPIPNIYQPVESPES